MKESTKNILKTAGRWCLVLLILVAISLAAALVLNALGVLAFVDGGIVFNRASFEHFATSWYGWIILIALQLVITTALSFVPGISMAFIILLQELFPAPWQAFIVAFSGVLLSSLLMYITGRTGGLAIARKLLGEKDCERAADLLDRGVIFFPIMMLFPMFPDDALVMMAGTLKMSLKWFIPTIVICRGIGVATIVFGMNFIPFELFTAWWHWALFIGACAVGIAAVFYAAYRLNKYLSQKKAAEAEE